jgi:hypothetical protein
MAEQLAFDLHRARTGLVDAGEDLDQRAFARTILAQECHDLARVYVQGNASQGLRLPEAAAKAPDRQERRAACAVCNQATSVVVG